MRVVLRRSDGKALATAELVAGASPLELMQALQRQELVLEPVSEEQLREPAPQPSPKLPARKARA